MRNVWISFLLKGFLEAVIFINTQNSTSDYTQNVIQNELLQIFCVCMYICTHVDMVKIAKRFLIAIAGEFDRRSKVSEFVCYFYGGILGSLRAICGYLNTSHLQASIVLHPVAWEEKNLLYKKRFYKIKVCPEKSL